MLPPLGLPNLVEMRGNLTVSEMQATFASMTPTRLDSSAWGRMINNSKLNLIKNLFFNYPYTKEAAYII
jgi:hypothetical protein